MQPRKSDEDYTKFEVSRMIGSRALQIAMGAPFLVKLEKEDLEALMYNPIEIAKKEFEAGVLPISIKRPNSFDEEPPKK